MKIDESTGHMLHGPTSTTGSATGTGSGLAGAGAGARSGVLGDESRSQHGQIAGGNTSSGLTGHSGQQSGLAGTTHSTTTSGSGLTGSNHNTSTGSGLTGSTHNTSSGSGLIGSTHNTSSGLHGDQKTGLGSNQYGNTSTGLHGDQTSSGLTGSGLTGSHNSSDRNRLHKDPPSSHPAAHAGVPANSIERGNLVAEGERALDGKTGVANSHSQSGNSGTGF